METSILKKKKIQCINPKPSQFRNSRNNDVYLTISSPTKVINVHRFYVDLASIWCQRSQYQINNGNVEPAKLQIKFIIGA